MTGAVTSANSWRRYPSIPRTSGRRGRLQQIDGAMPRLNAIPPGCAHNPRCPEVFERCRVERPELMPAKETQAACWLYAEVETPACLRFEFFRSLGSRSLPPKVGGGA